MAGSKGSGRENKKGIFSLAMLIYAVLQSGRVLAITRCNTLFSLSLGKELGFSPNIQDKGIAKYSRTA